MHDAEAPQRSEAAARDESESAVRKCFRRVVPWCVLFYVLSYVDRINIGFAALSMNKDLGLTATKFGFSNTALFIMFCLSAVPSNMMLARLGARRWIPTLTIAWGIASIMTMFAVGPYSLYALRALVGLAEGGLMSGMIYYLGFWFPKEHRAKANSLYLASQPIALTLGPVSGAILELNGWLGLEGWRWLFLIEGIPSILVGIAALYLLPNAPSEVSWLTAGERTDLIARLDREQKAINKGEKKPSLRQEILNSTMIVLALTYFCVMATTNSLAVWAPQIVKEMVQQGGRPFIIGVLVSLPPLVALFVMQGVCHHADRTGEHARHLLWSMTAIAVGWVTVVVVQMPAAKLLGLVISSCGCYSSMALFWATAVQVIPRRSQAVGIGFVSTVATVATFVTPLVIGVLRDHTHDFYAGIWYLAALIVVGIGMLMSVSGNARRMATSQ